MEGIMNLLKDERTNTFFRDIAIIRVKVAFRIKEYLDPDPAYPARDLSKETLSFFLDRDFDSAVNNIFYEVGLEDKEIDLSILDEGINFSATMLDKFLKNKDKELISERERLLKRLDEINDSLINCIE